MSNQEEPNNKRAEALAAINTPFSSGYDTRYMMRRIKALEDPSILAEYDAHLEETGFKATFHPEIIDAMKAQNVPSMNLAASILRHLLAETEQEGPTMAAGTGAISNFLCVLVRSSKTAPDLTRILKSLEMAVEMATVRNVEILLLDGRHAEELSKEERDRFFKR